MKKILTAAIFLGLALGHGAAWAEDAPGENYVDVLGDLLVKPDAKHNPKLDRGYGLELRYGYRSAKPWGYEVRAFYGVLKPSDASVSKGHRSGLGVDAIYRLPAVIGLTVYGVGGIALAYNDALPGRDWIAPVVNLGAGIVTAPLTSIMGRDLRLRGELRYSYEDYRDEYSSATNYDRSNYLDRHVYFGVELGFAKPPPPPPPSEPVQIVEPVAPAPAAPVDSDGDGVNDDVDACPASPAGKPVDAKGCTVLTLKGVTFELDSDKLRPESNTILDEAAAALTADFPAARIEVAGHTDNTGGDAHNQDLSLRRAQAVRDYLVAHGVSAERLTAAGYGASEPVASNDLPEGRSENRRVELRVQGEEHADAAAIKEAP